MIQHNRQAANGRSQAAHGRALVWVTATRPRRARTRSASAATAGQPSRIYALAATLTSLRAAPLLQAQADSLPATVSAKLKLARLLLRTHPRDARTEHWIHSQVQPGQSLAELFRNQGLALADACRAQCAAAAGLNPLHPGQQLEFLLAPSGSLLALRYNEPDGQRSILLFEGEQVSGHHLSAAATHASAATAATRLRTIDEQISRGIIKNSLFSAGTDAGLNHATTLALANIFKYDIDFSQDLRAGDRFSVLYRSNGDAQPAEILAAEFINRGSRVTAYRFKPVGNKEGWYSEDGRPIQKSFLRIPVDFTRISSSFSAARKHPILGRMRAHKGIDYAAPSGTPIHASGDGVVVFRDRQSGYGHFMLIQHNATISTAYGHISRFGKIRLGTHVHQGEVIGYVGMTGLATGPHLHYEFRVNGAQRNPEKVATPRSAPLPPAQLARFHAEVVRPQLARLEDGPGQRQQLASNTAYRNSSQTRD